ncbi:MAG: indole-3-glycerol phosphate synthase TrpC [Magnetococcales bacterium]|nr:indole-3-glycerol phosphate synthase TrpC [Magnetococcales bacterium]
MSVPNILQRIMTRKQEEVSERRATHSESALLSRITEQSPTRGFAEALRNTVNQRRPAIIAEVKRASPSRGMIHPNVDNFDPALIASGYEKNGAVCLSCLTDKDFFKGDDRFIAPIREAGTLPILRKDFLYDPYQVLEARAIGADAILLIMAVLSRSQAQELESAAFEQGLDVLVEVHDEAELEAAHDLKTPLLGINNRNLKTFETTLQTTLDLMARADDQRIVISESGIQNASDINHLMKNGVFSFLIGASFMRDADPGAALATMLKDVQAS